MAEKGKFELYKDVGGQFRWRLKGPNGEPIASGEAYTTKESCKDGIAAVRKYAGDADFVDLT